MTENTGVKLIKKQYYCGRKEERDIWVKELSRLVRYELFKTKTSEETKSSNKLKALGTDQIDLKKVIEEGKDKIQLPISKR